MANSRHNVVLDGKRLRLSNLAKVLYPEVAFTKGEVIDYYLRIAPVMLPHLRHRPITLKRYPDGVNGGFFFEKTCPSHRPKWMGTYDVFYGTENKNIRHCIINDRASLVWAANLAAIELHTSLARARTIERPTMIAFDLDPGPPASLIHCLGVAVHLRDMLAQLGLQCLAKTSGGAGLHVYVPLNSAADYEATRNFAHAAALALERHQRAAVTSRMSKAGRAGKVFVDWSQNSMHKTMICAYSLRARARPTVSAPLTWDEIESALAKDDAQPLIFESAQILDRIERLGDLFAPVLRIEQKLPRG